MGRKGETTKFKGAKPAPSEAAKKERKRKKKRDREDEKDAERLGARARLNRSRPECPVCFDEVATHKLLPCSHSYCLEHAQQCLQRGSCAICRQAPRFHQPLYSTWQTSRRRSAASSRASSWHGRVYLPATCRSPRNTQRQYEKLLL